MWILLVMLSDVLVLFAVTAVKVVVMFREMLVTIVAVRLNLTPLDGNAVAL
jgi:hypothetical protein